MPTGKAVTASGLELPHITLTREDGDQHRFLQANRDAYTGVKAYYYEVNSAEKKEAIAGEGENIKELRHSYTDQASALKAARAELSRLQRGTATLSYTLARGRPDLVPDMTYSLVGVKFEIGEIIWLGGNIRHSFTPDSFTTSLELESQLPEGMFQTSRTNPQLKRATPALSPGTATRKPASSISSPRATRPSRGGSRTSTKARPVRSAH